MTTLESGVHQDRKLTSMHMKLCLFNRIAGTHPIIFASANSASRSR